METDADECSAPLVTSARRPHFAQDLTPPARPPRVAVLALIRSGSTQLTGHTTPAQVAEAKSFSVGSPEARAAWAAVEEIEGADNSAATKPSLADECDALNPSKECREYANSMAELEAILASSKAKSDSIKVQVSKFAQTPLPSSSSASPAETPGAAAAVAAAEKASSEFGPTSSEAKAAWAVVEEINDSLDAPAAALPGLDQDCVVAALEKCREFDAAMASLEKSLAAMK